MFLANVKGSANSWGVKRPSQQPRANLPPASRPGAVRADPSRAAGQRPAAPPNRPSGNAWWGAGPAVPSPGGDNPGRWASGPAAPQATAASGWGPSAAWPAPHPHQGLAAAPGAFPGRSAAGGYAPDDPYSGAGWGQDWGEAWDTVATQPAGYPAGEWAPRPCGAQAAAGWPTEESFHRRHPAAAPVSQRPRMYAEPAVGAGPPSMPSSSSAYPAHQTRVPAAPAQDPAAGGDALKPARPAAPPQRIATDTKVVCAPMSRVRRLAADSSRWVVLLARLEDPPPPGRPRRQFAVREPDGTRTECVFYELDRPLPALAPGKWVRCVGRPDARGTFVCVTARPAARQDIGLHRQLQQLAAEPTASG